MGDAIAVPPAAACAGAAAAAQGLRGSRSPYFGCIPPGAPLSAGKLQGTDVCAPALDTGMSVPQARR